MSTKNAGLAKKEGYKNIRVYLEGQPAWIKAGNLVYASKGTIEKGNIVLIDLRPEKTSAQGHIPRSVTIPYATLDDRLDDIPMKAPIVLYGDSEETTAEAYEDLRDEGFKKVALVPGNYRGWVQAGGNTVQGKVVTTISWKRKLGKGEISLKDFEKAAKGMDNGAVILDVRTADETAAGHFKTAVTIPLDQLSTDLGKLPKDKKIYVHCSTGARADMAAQELKKNGYKAFFLVADVACEGEQCTVSD